MTDRELMQQALDALEQHSAIQHPQQRHYRDAAIDALRERLAQPEQEPVAWLHRDSWGTLKLSQTMPPPVGAFPVYTAPQQELVIDKAAATRIATALGWVPPGDTSQDRVDQAQKQRQEQEPVVKWDASAPLVVHPHPAFQATPPRREWVGLTDEEIRFIAWGDFGVDQEKHLAEVLPLARAIEAKLLEKNT